METIESFSARVLARTGQELTSIPVLNGWPQFGGAIFARRGGTFVVGVGYPEISEEGEEIWTSFGVVEEK